MKQYHIRKITDQRYIIMEQTGKEFLDVAVAQSRFMAEKIIKGLEALQSEGINPPDFIDLSEGQAVSVSVPYDGDQSVVLDITDTSLTFHLWTKDEYEPHLTCSAMWEVWANLITANGIVGFLAQAE